MIETKLNILKITIMIFRYENFFKQFYSNMIGCKPYYKH